jgi:fucose permease
MGRAFAGAGWNSGYRAISLIQLSLAAVFLISLPLWKREGAVPTRSEESLANRPKAGSTPKWAAWLGPFLYLVYSAIEVGTGLWTASVLVESRGMAQATAGIFVSFFYGSIMAGRFLTGLIAEKAGNRNLVRAGLLIAFSGAILFSLSGAVAPLTLAALILIGLGCAPIYPSLMHETPRRYDPETARAVVDAKWPSPTWAPPSSRPSSASWPLTWAYGP